MYFGIIGMVWALASATGPVLGGVFTQLVTWRWCFYINLPCDGLAFVVLFFFLDIHTPTTPFLAGIKAIDWLGSLTIVGGTLMFLLGLEFGGVTFAWNSATVLCLLIFGVITIALFFLLEWKVPKYPLMPLRLFNDRSNLASLATCFLHGFTFISASYFLPLYFQSVLGASPLLSGIYLFPFAISLSLVSAVTGLIIRKTGAYLRCIWFGTFFMTLGFGLLINLQAYPSWPRIIIFQIVAGIGVGPNFQSPLLALQNRVQRRDIAAATATFAFTRNLATSVSVVIGGVIFQNQLSKYIMASELPASLQAQLAGGSAGADTGLIAALPPAQRDTVTGSYALSLHDMWIFYTCSAFIGLLVSLLIKQKAMSTTHEVTRTGLEAMEGNRKEALDREKARKEEKGARKSVISGDPTRPTTAAGIAPDPEKGVEFGKNIEVR